MKTMRIINFAISFLLLGKCCGFANYKGGRQKTAARLAATKQCKPGTKNDVLVQKKRWKGSTDKDDDMYQFQKRLLKARIRNDIVYKEEEVENSKAKLVVAAGMLRALSGSQVGVPVPVEDEPVVEAIRNEEKGAVEFQQRLFAARVRYEQDKTNHAKKKRSVVFHQRLLEAQIRNDFVTAKQRMKEEDAMEVVGLETERVSSGNGIDQSEPVDRTRTASSRAHVGPEDQPERQRGAGASCKFRFQQKLLKARMDNEREKTKRVAGKRRAVFRQKLLEARMVTDLATANASIADKRRALLRQALLESHIRNDSVTKQKRIERRKFEVQQRLLEARIGYDRSSNRKGDRQSLPVSVVQVKEDAPTGDNTKILFQQRLLQARLRNDSIAKHKTIEKKRLAFQQRLMEARIGYYRSSLPVLKAKEEDAKAQFRRASKETTCKSSKLAVTEKYLAAMFQGTSTLTSVGLTAQYLDAIQAVASRGEIVGLSGHYLAALQVGAESVDPQAEKRFEAEKEARRQAGGSAVNQRAPALEHPTVSLVGRTLLDKFDIVYKLDDTVSDKCDLYIAHHVTDHAKQDPLIVKLASCDYYGPIKQITLEYSIYQDLFSRLPTEAEQRLFVRPYDWIDSSPATDGKAGFVMECGSTNLRGLIWENGPCTGDVLRRSMENVIRIVYALHNLGTVWTELKAENFIVFGNGDIKAIDLESIAAHNETLRMYTAETYPPEFPADMLYQGLPDKPLDYSYDIWGLGLTLFEMATGQPFYTLDRTYDVEYIKSRLKDPRGITSEVYAKLSEVEEGARNVILQCLTIDPRMRRSCEDLLKDPYFVIGRQDDTISGTAGNPTIVAEAPNLLTRLT